MENRKPSRKSVDQLTLTKSAAWAWHQRGSEFSGKPINEFHGGRNKVNPYKPSRYKLEAMRRKEEEEEEETFNSDSTPKFSSLRSKSVASSLLDEYEIARIFRKLDYHSERRKAEEAEEMAPAATKEMKSKSRLKKNKSSRWIWPIDDVACGRSSSINDVVKSTSFEYSLLRSGSQKSNVAVVNDVGYRYPFQDRRNVVAKVVGGFRNFYKFSFKIPTF